MKHNNDPEHILTKNLQIHVMMIFVFENNQ